MKNISVLLFFPEEAVKNKYGKKIISFSWMEQLEDIKKPIKATIRIETVLPNLKESEAVYVKINQ